MNKNAFRTIMDYLVVVVIAAYVGLLGMLVATIPIRFMTHNINIEEVLESIASVISSTICLFILCYNKGYKEKMPQTRCINTRLLIYMSISVIVYIILTIIFRYQTGAATNVSILARILSNVPSTVDIKRMASEHSLTMFISLIIQTIPFIPSMLLGYYVGAQKREKDRNKLVTRQ